MAIKIGDVARSSGDEDEEEDEEELGSLVNESVALSASASASHPLERHASMACMWHTTVPQSLTPLSELGGSKRRSKSMRHAPTRRSLRHSRMLVSSKGGGGAAATTEKGKFRCNLPKIGINI